MKWKKHLQKRVNHSLCTCHIYHRRQKNLISSNSRQSWQISKNTLLRKTNQLMVMLFKRKNWFHCVMWMIRIARPNHIRSIQMVRRLESRVCVPPMGAICAWCHIQRDVFSNGNGLGYHPHGKTWTRVHGFACFKTLKNFAFLIAKKTYCRPDLPPKTPKILSGKIHDVSTLKKKRRNEL